MPARALRVINSRESRTARPWPALSGQGSPALNDLENDRSYMHRAHAKVRDDLATGMPGALAAST
jgi:hypothetical protein